MKTIFEVLSSGHKLDKNKYKEYTTDTAKLYVDLLHPMTPTKQKILIHGSLKIEHALLPIGKQCI